MSASEIMGAIILTLTVVGVGVVAALVGAIIVDVIRHGRRK